MHRRFWSWQAKRSGGKSSRSWADPAEQGSRQDGTQTVLPPFCDPATIEEGVDEAAMKWGPPREHASADHATADWKAPTEELPPFIVDDYIVRIEWQKRGMPHAHILLWAMKMLAKLRRAGQVDSEPPLVPHDYGDDDAESADWAEEPRSVPEVYDSYIVTTAPERWQKIYKNPIMADLAKRVRHNHSAYCGFRSTGACRFGFPQKVVKNTKAKTSQEQKTSRSKNNFYVRRTRLSGLP